MFLRRLTFAACALASLWAGGAATDCIRTGGQMLCSEPRPGPVTVSLCGNLPPFMYAIICENRCFAATNEANMVAQTNCFENCLTGCGGAAANFPGWLPPGGVLNIYNCANVTATAQNGVLTRSAAYMTSLAQTKDGQGNCTQMGNFPVGVMAVLNRTLDCDPGWSVGSWPNGDVRCYRCPENSTWSGSDCVCGPGYYKDPRTKLCLPGCTSDAECSTGDFCRTGLCNLLQHRCQTTATYCDDDKKCTVDSCEFGQCANTFDKSSCTCTLAASIPVRKIQVKIPAVDLSVGLPGMPGSLGVKADITGKLTLKRPSCVNDCKGEASGSGEMALAVTVGLQTDSISGEASYSQTEDHEIDCDQASCLQTCKADSCDKTTAKGALTVAREGTLKPLGWFKPEVNAKTPWGLQWTISVKGKGSITDELEYESTTRVGVLTTPCVNCTRLSSKISGSLGGKGSAEITLPPSGRATVGASGSADITVTVSGGSQGSAGECYMGDGACGFIRADAKGTVIGSFSAQMGWWKVGVTCSGVYSACSERNQCATCTCPNCASNDGTWSCNVDQNIGPPPPPKGKP